MPREGLASGQCGEWRPALGPAVPRAPMPLPQAAGRRSPAELQPAIGSMKASVRSGRTPLHAGPRFVWCTSSTTKVRSRALLTFI